MRYKNYSIVVFFLVLACVFSGCEEKRKALVTAHTATGELLITTKNQAKTLHQQKVIDDKTYHQIRINWLRAQTSYIKASDILETIIDNDTMDITAYTDLITQINTILSDIAIWLSEHPTPSPSPTGGKNESTDDRIISHPTPTPHYKADSGDTANTGVERAGQGSFEKFSAGDENKSSIGDVGKLKEQKIRQLKTKLDELSRYLDDLKL